VLVLLVPCRVVFRVAGTVIQGGTDSAKVLAADIRAGKVSMSAAVHQSRTLFMPLQTVL